MVSDKPVRRGRPRVPDERRQRTLTCYLEVRLIEHLDALAQQQGRPRNDLIKEALHHYLSVPHAVHVDAPERPGTPAPAPTGWHRHGAADRGG
jgi:hypothetical protein